MLCLTGLSGHEFNWSSKLILYSYSNFIICSVSDLISGLSSSVTYVYLIDFFFFFSFEVAEWTDMYGIHHWMIVWSSYRKFPWVVFEPTIPEFRSDPLTDWALSPWVQLALTANFVQLLQFYLIFSIRLHFKFSFISRQVYLIEIFLRKFFFYIYNLHFIKQKIYSH